MDTRLPKWLLVVLVLAYLFICVNNLAYVPMVYEDEPILASTGWKLAAEGVFGSDLFTGYFGMERHIFIYFPVHSVMLAAVFKALGLGLLQTRLLTVAAGLAVILLTYALGERLFSPAVGILAVIFMLTLRNTATTPSQLSGILFLDMARIGRYDMLVPVFGLGAIKLYLSARDRASGIYLFYSGLLAGLSTLSHPNGIFWLATLLLHAAWDRWHWPFWSGLFAGFLLPWLPYFAYVLGDLPDWSGQTRMFGPRLDITDPGWYLNNLLTEPKRYSPGFGNKGWLTIFRPGVWISLLAIPFSLAGLGRRAFLKNDFNARVLVLPALVFPAGLALFVTLKLANYLVAVIPLAALILSWGFVSMWNRAGAPRTLQIRRLVLVCLLLAVTLEGFSRILLLYQAGNMTTTYSGLIREVKSYIPPGSRVLGLHNYWFGMEDFVFRSWALPIFHTFEDRGEKPDAAYDTLIQIDPEYLLIDPRMRAFFANPENSRTTFEIQRWLADQQTHQIASIDDQTYGRIQIFKVNPQPE